MAGVRLLNRPLAPAPPRLRHRIHGPAARTPALCPGLIISSRTRRRGRAATELSSRAHAASMFSLFQAYWGQRQSYILWACLQSEPTVAAGTVIFFFLGTLVIQQILGNIHVAGPLTPSVTFARGCVSSSQ